MPAGTIALTNNSATVTGTGTSFTTELKVNDFLVSTVGGVAYTFGVKSIESNTSLTLIEKYSGPSASGQAWTPVPFGTMAAITAQLAAQVTYAIRGSNLDKVNWQKIYSSAPSVTVSLPDLNTFTGPSWGYLAEQLNNFQDSVDGKASKGANSDITSLTGLTTALSIQQGGTGAKSVSTALGAFGFISPGAGRLVVPTSTGQFLLTITTVVTTLTSLGEATITYPQAFASNVSVTASSGDLGAFEGPVSLFDSTNVNSFRLRCRTSSGANPGAITVRINYCAMGRI